MLESIAEYYPEALRQRCTVHFYRDVFSVVPRRKVSEVATMLKAIHACEDRESALQKAELVSEKLEQMRLLKAAEKVRNVIQERLTHYTFPANHWSKIRINNTLERVMKEIRRRTRTVGAFPDRHLALMLSADRLMHVAGTKWGLQRYGHGRSKRWPSRHKSDGCIGEFGYHAEKMCERLLTLPMPIHNWEEAMNWFMIEFGERLTAQM